MDIPNAHTLPSNKLGFDFPPLVIVTVVAVLIALFFEEAFWHNSICPFGTVLNLSSKPAFKSVKINEDLCTSCGKCQKVCPVGAISYQ
ncbi:MAG: 4Fe-4S dicluster domain-containing protein [Spirochaetaceae bacterium]|nr:MAG: 4Fe-4S dicluster domain-containing protein [Spirochaetaceae bacterium]